MTVTICNGKGGTGKTTLAVLLLLALRRLGHRAVLVDRDPQATATRWLETLGEPPAAETDASLIRIVDTPPQLTSPALALSLQEADLVVLASSSSPADLWTSQATVAVIRANLREGRQARLFFNQVQRNTLLGRNLARLAERIGLPALEHSLSRRQSFQHAAIMGWDALDRASSEEMLALAGEIFQLIPIIDEK